MWPSPPRPYIPAVTGSVSVEAGTTERITAEELEVEGNGGTEKQLEHRGVQRPAPKGCPCAMSERKRRRLCAKLAP